MEKKPLFRRVLLKVSGEVLMGEKGFGIDQTVAERIVDEILQCSALGVEVALVVGGGNIFRGISLAQGGIDRARADDVGMLATVMNALILEQIFQKKGKKSKVFSALFLPKICHFFTKEAAVSSMQNGEIVLFSGGTGNPYFTTDTAAALRALEMECDLLLKGTSVDGVYTADPKKDLRAEKIPFLNYQDVLLRGLKVIDHAAICLAQEGRLPIAVFSIRTPGALLRVLSENAACSMIQAD